jgi:hypothetical protein
MRCGELFICVRGVWHYHWEAPSIRVDQLAQHSKSKPGKPAVCEEQSAAVVSQPVVFQPGVSQPAAPEAKSFR